MRPDPPNAAARVLITRYTPRSRGKVQGRQEAVDARRSVRVKKSRELPRSGNLMKQDERAPFELALRRARMSAYTPGEFVEQESFMRASEIRAVARRAGIAPGVSVLDLCCGVAGPGRLITRELG